MPSSVTGTTGSRSWCFMPLLFLRPRRPPPRTSHRNSTSSAAAAPPSAVPFLGLPSAAAGSQSTLTRFAGGESLPAEVSGSAASASGGGAALAEADAAAAPVSWAAASPASALPCMPEASNPSQRPSPSTAGTLCRSCWPVGSRRRPCMRQHVPPAGAAPPPRAPQPGARGSPRGPLLRRSHLRGPSGVTPAGFKYDALARSTSPAPGLHTPCPPLHRVVECSVPRCTVTNRTALSRALSRARS